jgi:hypothetical protein
LLKKIYICHREWRDNKSLSVFYLKNRTIINEKFEKVMKKSLLWVLMLALSFVVIPSCGDEEEGTKEETVTSSYEQLGGKYSGDLTSAGTAIAEDLNVNVETVGDNKINLSLDPISIMNIPINDMGFDGIDVVGKDGVWSFSLESQEVQIMGESQPVSVEGKITPDGEKGKLEFSVTVLNLGISLDYIGTK